MSEETLFADGLEDALLGIGRQYNNELAVYDYEKVIEILMRDGISREDAEEHFEFNIVGAWVGPLTPVFLVIGDGDDIEGGR